MALRRFKEILAAGELVRVFQAGRVFHPVVFELFGLAGGYHGFWLDGEHVGLSTHEMTVAALAARANGFDCFARIPPIGYWHVTQCLETGMGGVMAAQIHDVQQAEQFVCWAKFAPRGGRGLNVGGRDADYSHKPPARFVADANRESFVAIQIETAGALADVDRIAAIEGVDLLFIGPADLSLALGIVGQFHHDELWRAIEHVAAACRRKGKHWGAVVPDPQFASRAVESGCRLITIGGDLLAVRRGIEAFRAAFAAHFPA
jgi:2-dehydro-3-deoxyglucarate aldolase/4-hydroxy-2-oxoheptanedioate aldolase